ncbi:hypothetical protein ABPG75_005379 [Micractinium tetrahymenae]
MRQLHVGGMAMRPTEQQLLEVFALYGPIESVTIHVTASQAGKFSATVCYTSPACAAAARQNLRGKPQPQLTGGPPLTLRFVAEPLSVSRETVAAAKRAGFARGGPGGEARVVADRAAHAGS